jgi:hypothetical protein
MNSKKGLLVTAALAGLMMAAPSAQAKEKGAKNQGSQDKAAAAADEQVVGCYGVNKCGKGKGQCGASFDGGKITTSCHGQNSCKGKGMFRMKAKECKEQGGIVADT